MKRYYISPLQLIGYEGMWAGLFAIFSLLPMSSNIVCYSTSMCATGFLEDPVSAWNELSQSVTLLVLTGLGVLFGSLADYYSLCVAKNVSSPARCIIDLFKALFVWVYSLFFRDEQMDWIQVGGFALLIFGNLVLNEIMDLPGKRLMKRTLF